MEHGLFAVVAWSASAFASSAAQIRVGVSCSTLTRNVGRLRQRMQSCSDATWSCNVDVCHPFSSHAWLRATEKPSRYRPRPIKRGVECKQPGISNRGLSC